MRNDVPAEQASFGQRNEGFHTKRPHHQQERSNRYVLTESGRGQHLFDRLRLPEDSPPNLLVQPGSIRRSVKERTKRLPIYKFPATLPNPENRQSEPDVHVLPGSAASPAAAHQPPG